MASAHIIGSFTRSGATISARVGRSSLGDVELSLQVNGQVRNFAIDDGAPAPSHKLTIPGGGQGRRLKLSGWGAAEQGARVVLCVTTTDEGEDVSSCTVV